MKNLWWSARAIPLKNISSIFCTKNHCKNSQNALSISNTVVSDNTKSIQKAAKLVSLYCQKRVIFKCLRAKTFTLCKILFLVPKLYIFLNKHTVCASVWFFYFLSLSGVFKFIARDGQTIYVCASRQRIEKCELLLKESEISRRSRGGGIEERSEEKPYRPGSLKRRCTLKRWPPSAKRLQV